jgi:hypothetical protein
VDSRQAKKENFSVQEGEKYARGCISRLFGIADGLQQAAECK